MCGVEILPSEDNTIAKVKGNKNHPGSKGYVCNKAGRLAHYQNGKDRILEPLRRKADGSFETVSWDTAIAEISEKLLSIKRSMVATRYSILLAARAIIFPVFMDLVFARH